MQVRAARKEIRGFKVALYFSDYRVNQALLENGELVSPVLLNSRIKYYKAVVIIHVESVEKDRGQQAVPDALGRIRRGKSNCYIAKLLRSNR